MMQKTTIAIGLGVFLLAGVVGYLLQQDRQETTPVSRPAVDAGTLGEFTLPDVSGVERQSAEWHGKARLVNFWATWCAPCRREIPLLKATQQAHAGNNLQIIGIAVDFPAEVAAYAEEAQFNYPVLVGQEDAMAVAETSGVEFIGLPFTMVVAPSGELIKAHIGEIVAEHIERIVAVFAALENGTMDIAAARAALADL